MSAVYHMYTFHQPFQGNRSHSQSFLGVASMIHCEIIEMPKTNTCFGLFICFLVIKRRQFVSSSDAIWITILTKSYRHFSNRIIIVLRGLRSRYIVVEQDTINDLGASR